MGEGLGTLVAKLARSRSSRLAELLKGSGLVGSPDVLAARSVRNSLFASLVAVPAGALLGILFSPWLLLLAASPLAVALAPELRLRDMVAQRREGVERELPFFAILVSVLGSAGVPLYSAFRDLAGNDVFECLGKEALLVKRDVEILGMNANDAFERLASSHPSKRFCEFLLGYTSKARSGGDVPLYLVAESGALLGDLEEGWSRYVSGIGLVGSMMITVFGVVPLLLMVMGVFSPGVSVLGLVLFTALGVPTFTVGLLFMAGRMQPTQGEQLRGKGGTAAALALPGALVGLVARTPWVGAATALLLFFAAYGFSVRRELAETKGEEEGVGRFLKDLLEYKRQDYDLARAVIAIEAAGHYNACFSSVLSRAAAQLKAGVPLDEIRVRCRSRLGKLTFLLLGEMSRSGGGTVDTVYQLSRFASQLTGMRQKASAEMKPYLVLSYASPILLAFGVTFVQGVLSSFGRRAAPGIPALHFGLQVGSVPPGLSQVSSLLIVVSAASLGLIGAKITDMTVRNTLRAAANVAVAVAAMAFMAALSSHSLSQLV